MVKVLNLVLLFLLYSCHVGGAKLNYAEFHGHETTYAAYDAWNICSDSKLSFEFSTEFPDGLLLYMDDGGISDFIQVRLVNGEIKMRLKLSQNHTMRSSLGESLNDGFWHKVTILRDDHTTSIIVDKIYQKMTAGSSDTSFGEFHSPLSDLFIGGLPKSLESQLNVLSDPFTVYDRRFAGKVRNLMYSDCTSSSLKAPRLKHHMEVSLVTSKSCPLSDSPCKNGGICYKDEGEIYCDCSQIDYTGYFCNIERSQAIATFSGSEFISYNFTGKGNAITHTTEQIEFSFKTSVGDGLIFFTGDGSYYLNVGLANGIVYVNVYMGDSQTDGLKYVGQGRRFDDDNWHRVLIDRQVSKIFVSVDNQYEQKWSETGNFSDLTSRVMFLGGANDVVDLPGTSASQSFYGCLKGVKFSPDSLNLDILKLVNDQSSLLKVHGKLTLNGCDKVTLIEPITILEPQHYIKLPAILDTSNSFVSVTFTTNERDGLLMYSTGDADDVFALELLDGSLYLVLQRGEEVIRKKLAADVADSNKHTVAITFRSWGAGVLVDGVPKSTVVVGDLGAPALLLKGHVYLAGLEYSDHSLKLHPTVYTASLKKGFVGCLQDVKIDGMIQDLKKLSLEQLVSIGDGCTKSSIRHCSSVMCAREGQCTEGWNRPVCDCINTSYTGKQCERDAAIMRFDGNQHFSVINSKEKTTLAEDITLKFKTSFSYGHLLVTEGGDSSVQIYLKSGRLIVEYTLGSVVESIVAGEILDDNKWHIVQLYRIAKSIQVKVDGVMISDTEIKIGDTEDWRLYQLKVIRIKLGLPVIQSASSIVWGFAGSIQHFTYNGDLYFDQAARGQKRGLEYTARITSEPLPPINIVNMPNSNVISLNVPEVNNVLSYSLQFKTSNENGLLLYQEDRNSGDFIGVELLTGTIRMVYRLDGNTELISTNSNTKLNDLNWHQLVVTRLINGKFYMRVDDMTFIGKWNGNGKETQLSDTLKLSGVEDYIILPDTMMSPHGFSGCIASLEINSLRPDLMMSKDSQVSKGCPAHEQCNESTCMNGGTCMQTLQGLTCNCDMTTYTGPSCSQESMGYEFKYRAGSTQTAGVILYSYPEPHDTREDSVAFRLSTEESDATLLRVISANSDDMLELKLRQGKILITYNIGTINHNIGDIVHPVSDGKLHFIRFKRDGGNSTLQIDDNSPVPIDSAKDEMLKVFNGISQVQIGASYSNTGDIKDAFTGSISGFNFNGLYILDLAASKDSQVKVIGSARPSSGKLSDAPPTADSTTGPFSLTLTSTSKSLGQQVLESDDIIQSGSGMIPCEDQSGDGAECSESSSDEIITASATPIPSSERTTPSIVNNSTSTTGKPTSKIIPLRTTAKSKSQVLGANNNLPIDHDTDKTPPSAGGVNAGHQPPPIVDVTTKATIRGSVVFEFQKNIPLISGISAAGLLTLLLIAIIAWRLTRKPSTSDNKSCVDLPPPPDDIYLPDELNSSDTSNNNKPNGTKEWYV